MAEIQNRNRTGEPGTDATCNQCHGGGSFGATTAINVLDPNSGAAVSEYLPGEQYVLEIAIGGTSPRFGMQATAVDAAGGNAGSFGNPSNNTQLEDVGGCTYDFACNYNAIATFDDGSCEIESCAVQGDLDGDGSVNVNDLLLLLANFGAV